MRTLLFVLGVLLVTATARAENQSPLAPVTFGTFDVLLNPDDLTVLYLDFKVSAESTLLTRQMHIFTTPERQAVASYLQQLRASDAVGAAGEARVSAGVTRAIARAMGCSPASVHLADFALRVRRPNILPAMVTRASGHHNRS